MKEPKNKISMGIIDYLNPIAEKNGSTIIYDKMFYEDDGLSDFKDGFRFWVFTRQFVLKVSKTGRPLLKVTRDCKEVFGKTRKEMLTNLDALVTGCEGEAPKQAGNEWLPDDVIKLKAAVKSGALKV